MKNKIVTILICLFLNSCASAASTPTFTLPSTITPIPSATPNMQAADFGDLILAAIQGMSPHIQDDFSIDRGWFGTWGGDPLHYRGMVAVDGGYIRAVDDSARGYTHMQTEEMSHLGDFVLMVEAGFLGVTRPAGQRKISLCWWPGDMYGEVFYLDETGQFQGGTNESDIPGLLYATGSVAPIPPGTSVTLTLVHYGHESAVYVDSTPVVYHDLPFSWRKVGVSLCPSTSDGLPSDHHLISHY